MVGASACVDAVLVQLPAASVESCHCLMCFLGGKTATPAREAAITREFDS